MQGKAEHLITLLRSGKLLETSEWKTDAESMKVAIEKLNGKCDKRLLTKASCITLRSCTKEDFGIISMSWESTIQGIRYSRDSG